MGVEIESNLFALAYTSSHSSPPK